MGNDEIEKRVAEIAEYVANTGATVRAAAERFGVSKSTVHTAATITNCGWYHKQINNQTNKPTDRTKQN